MSSTTPDQSFESLIADITENPEKLLDPSITPEQILEIQKRMNPYAYVVKDSGSEGHKKTVAASYTNLRADYLQRFTMTAMVGYVFRMLDEWEAPVKVRQWEDEGEAPAAWTPGDLVKRAAALLELATGAKEASDAADAAVESAKQADETLATSQLEDRDDAEIARQTAIVADKFKAADSALSKSRGLQYITMYEMRCMGEDSDNRIDRFLQVARQHPEVRAMLDRAPARRKATEMPASAAQKVVSSFLREMFEYNPDAHVRSAYDEFVSARDSTEVEIAGLGKVLADKVDPERLPLSVVRAAAPAFASEEDRGAFESLTAGSEAYNAAAYLLRNESAAMAFVHAFEGKERFSRYMFPIAPDSDARYSSTYHTPTYTHLNFVEKLAKLGKHILCEKPLTTSVEDSKRAMSSDAHA